MERFKSPGIAGGPITDRDIVRLLLEQKNQLEKMEQQIGCFIEASKNKHRGGSHDVEKRYVPTNCIEMSFHSTKEDTAGIEAQKIGKVLPDHDYAASIKSHAPEERSARRNDYVSNESVLVPEEVCKELDGEELPEVGAEFRVLEESSDRKSYVSTGSEPDRVYD